MYLTEHNRPFIERLHTEITGNRNGPPVLLLHGWGSSASLMQPVARALEDDYRVYNLDLAGHGESPPPPHPYDVASYAADVAGFLTLHRLARVSVIGHSNGGRIALYMAAHPQMREFVERLALVSPSGIPRKRTLAFLLKKGLAAALKAPFQILPEPWRSRGMEWLRYTLPWRLLGSSDYRALHGVMRETFVRTVNSYLGDELRSISVPALIFRGTMDTDITDEQVRAIENRIPGAAVVELPEAGHYGYLDRPDIFIPAVRHFLKTT